MFFYFSIGKLHKNTPQNFLICLCGSSLERQTMTYFLSAIMAPASICFSFTVSSNQPL